MASLFNQYDPLLVALGVDLYVMVFGIAVILSMTYWLKVHHSAWIAAIPTGLFEIILWVGVGSRVETRFFDAAMLVVAGITFVAGLLLWFWGTTERQRLKMQGWTRSDFRRALEEPET